jgi:cell division transport system ATP-binding protein
MIVLRNVSKVFDFRVTALNDVTLSVPKGDFVFLVGHNGAGKTTLLSLLVRSDQASSGVVLVGGQDLALMRESEIPLLRRRFGIVFQDLKLFPSKTVAENVALAMQVQGWTGKRARTSAADALEMVGLQHRATFLPGQISGGEQRKAAIARAIVHRPEIFIADEPTASLSPEAAWEITSLLMKINQLGITTIVATHDKDVVDGFSRRVVALETGRVVRDVQVGKFQEN